MKITPFTLQYEKAKEVDLAALNQLALRSKAHWGYPQAWLDHWREDMTLRPQHLLDWTIIIAKNEAGVIGFGAVEITNAFCEVHHLWLLPDHMGKGYGKKLLTYLLNTCSTKSLPVKVVADPHAEGFYARFGFETIAQQESWPAGRFLPVMEWIR